MGSWLRCAFGFVALVLTGACGTSSSTSVNPNAPSSGRCAVTATAQPAAVSAPGGSGAITVSTNRECAWEAASEADWLSLGSTRAGQGDGTVAFTAATNPIVSERRGAVVINGLRVEIAQAAAACVFSLDAGERAVGAAGGRHDVVVSAQAGCAWTAVSHAAWIVVASGANGQGAGVVGVSVQPNLTLAPRTGTLTIAGQDYRVEQAPAGANPTDPNCAFTLSPPPAVFPAEGGTGSVTVTAASPGCAWTATSPVSWVTFAGAAGASGSGVVQFSVAPTPITTIRSVVVTIAGQPVEIVQAGQGAPPPPPPTPPPAPQPPPPPPPPAPPAPTCSFTVRPTSGSFPEAGGTGEVAVTASDPTCAWTAASGAAWITLAATGGTGSGKLAYTVAPTTETAPRSAPITVAGTTVTISQAAAAPACTYTLDRLAVSVGFAGSDNTTIRVDTTAGCAWTAVSNAQWITVTRGEAGSGNGEVRFAVAGHLGATGRTGTLTIAGQTVTVTQAGILNEQVMLDGDIANLSGSCPNRTFTLAGTLIAVNGATDYERRRDCSDLRNGRSVRVRGRGQADGSILANRIDRLGGDDDDDDDDD